MAQDDRLERLFAQWAELRAAVSLNVDSLLKLINAADQVVVSIEREVTRAERERERSHMPEV